MVPLQLSDSLCEEDFHEETLQLLSNKNDYSTNINQGFTNENYVEANKQNRSYFGSLSNTKNPHRFLKYLNKVENSVEN